MSPNTAAVLDERRESLRSQLRANRGLIANRLDAANTAKNVYPRSVTMRLLTRHSAVTAPLLTEAAVLVLGSRSFRLIAAAALARFAARFGKPHA